MSQSLTHLKTNKRLGTTYRNVVISLFFLKKRFFKAKTIDENCQKLGAMIECQLNQFEIARTQHSAFIKKSEAQINEEEMNISTLKEFKELFNQDIQKVQKLTF